MDKGARYQCVLSEGFADPFIGLGGLIYRALQGREVGVICLYSTFWARFLASRGNLLYRGLLLFLIQKVAKVGTGCQ